MRLEYKVCILAAGKGTRNKYAVNSNKALLPLGEGTALSHIVSKFPEEVEIVLAVGYNAPLVKKYAYGKWGGRISFVDVEYEGERRGPGYSLYQCAALLQCPFVYVACDTIVTDTIPMPSKNWMGLALVERKEPYLTVEVNNKGLIHKVYDKGDKNGTYLASIGLVGVRDFRPFFVALSRPNKVQGEEQDSTGLRALIKYKLWPRIFNWLDTGTTEGYENANKFFSQTLSG